jgi:hypothetical protein
MHTVNVRSKPLLAVRYESQVYTTIWSEQLSREERELKREKSLNTRGKRHARAVLHVICLQFLQLRNTYYFRDLIFRIFFESYNIIGIDFNTSEFITICKKKLIKITKNRLFIYFFSKFL